MGIKIALKGQFFPNEVMPTDYVFPHENNSWASLLESDPRWVMQSLNISGAGKECYTLLITPNGIIYAYRRILPHRGDCAMVMLMAQGPAVDGQRLKDKLNDLLDYGLKATSSSSIDDAVVRDKISSCDDLFFQQRKPSLTPDAQTADKKDAYRIYATDNELFQILESPYQPVYSNYKCVHVVHESANPTPTLGSEAFHITQPVEEIYFFRLPVNVNVEGGKSYVSRSETFRLQYRKVGYKDEESPELSVAGNSSSGFFKIISDTLVVNPAEDCGLTFKREISLSVIAEETGQPITDWKIKNNSSGRWFDCTDNPTRMYLPDGEIAATIQADGFEETVVKLDARNKQAFTVRLKSKGSSKKVYLEPVWYRKAEKNSNISAPVTIKFSSNSLFHKVFYKELSAFESPKLYVMRKSPLPLLIWTGILALLLGVGIGSVGGHYVWPKENQVIEEPPKGGSSTEETTGEELVETGPLPDSFQTTQEKEDEKYLSENTTWERDKIKSEKYQELYKKLIMEDVKDSQKNVMSWCNDSVADLSRIDDYNIKNNQYWNELKTAIKNGIIGNGWKSSKNCRDKLIRCETQIDLEEVVKPPQKSSEINTDSGNRDNKDKLING